MIYKLIVNVAFLAIGYYIGKEVGLSARGRQKPAVTTPSSSRPAGKKTSSQTP